MTNNPNYNNQNINKSNHKQKVEIISNTIDKKEIDISPNKHYVKYKVGMAMRNDTKKDEKETPVNNERQLSFEDVRKPVSNFISLSESKLPLP